MALLRPYHAIILEGTIDLRHRCRQRARFLLRTETTIDPRGKPSIDRLLVVLDDGAFGFFDHTGLKLYAPTRLAAAALARDFRQYIRPPRDVAAQLRGRQRRLAWGPGWPGYGLGSQAGPMALASQRDGFPALAGTIC